MAHEYPEYNRHEFDHYGRQQCCQPTRQHHYPMGRRSTSRRCSQSATSQTTSFQHVNLRSHYIHDKNNIYEPPLHNGELHEETIPYGHPLIDYYTNSPPVPPWQQSPRQLRQRPHLPVRPHCHHHDDKDDAYSYNDNCLALGGLLFHNKVNDGGRYLDPMTSFPLPYQSTRPTRTPQQIYNQQIQPIQKVYRRNYYQPRHSLDLEYTDYFENDDDNEEDDYLLDSNNHHHHHYYYRIRQQPHIPPITKNTPKRRHSLQHLHQRYQQSSLWENSPIMGPSPDHSPIRYHQQQPVLQPTRQTDTQRPLSFYRQAPPNEPQLLPMPQPMIHTPSFLSHHYPQLGYGVPTVPVNSMPYSPMMMMPPLPPPSLADTQNSNGTFQQLETRPETAAATVPTPPPSDDIKTAQDSTNVSTPSPLVISSLSSSTSTSASASSKQNASVENSLVPLVRSLSLGGEPRSLGIKPRRRSLLESLFSLEGFKLSRNNSLSSTNTSTNNSTSSSSAITPTTSASTSSMIPIQELATHTLTRKQSLTLEKKVKALSQRSYIWCYQIKSSQQQQQANGCWVAMTPKNQIKLDPYICYYQPSAMGKGARMDRLSTLVTLDKEPKLSGSFTVMPQAKIARVYPSMFSSANYIEVLIDCLPADSQFVIMSG